MSPALNASARRCLALLPALLAGLSSWAAAGTPPELVAPLPDRHTRAGTATALVLDLAPHFRAPAAPGSVVALTLRFGGETRALRLALADADNPAAVAAFLHRLRTGDLADTILHRSAPGTELHGGAFRLAGENSLAPVVALTAPPGTAPRPPARGELALSPDGSGWFIQLDDPAPDAPPVTILGRLFASDLSHAAEVAALPRADLRTELGRAFGALPLTAPTPRRAHLVETHAAQIAPLTFTAVSSDADLVQVEMTAEGGLRLTPSPTRIGRALIRVVATDLDGLARETEFAFTVRQNFAAWRDAHPFARPEQAALDTDPDADGVPNLLEFALGSDPLVAAPGNPPRPEAGGGLAFTYRDTADPVLEVQHSTDLVTWTTLWRRENGLQHPAVASSSTHGDAISLVVRPPLDTPAAGRRFWRLRAQPAAEASP